MLRLIYVVLLRLHPRFFRDQFAAEMLWIFDQASGTRAAVEFLADAAESLATQWMFRGDFDEHPGLAAAGPALDRVPVFYTAGSELPPPAALFNGLLGSVAVFAAACFALFYGGNHARVFTYYGNDFHSGPPTARERTVGPPMPGAKPDPAAEPALGFLARLKFLLTKTPPDGDPGTSGAPTQPGSWARTHSPASGSGAPGVPSIKGTSSPPVTLSDPDPAIRRKLRYFKAVPVLAALDSNQDGELSAQEIDAATAVLGALDKNHDGQLDPEECGYHPPAERSNLGAIKLLMSFDDNKDGKLQRDELPPHLRRLFNQFDANHDGFLSADEIAALAKHLSPTPPATQPAVQAVRQARVDFMRLEPVLAALDANHDGVISAAEIHNASAALKLLDANGDGRLQFNEVAGNPLNNEATAIFRLDSNFDGKISVAERKTAFGGHVRPLLDAADRNHDGFVTWEELTQEIRRRADLNHDGVVTFEEMMEARKSGKLYQDGVAWRLQILHPIP